MNLIPKILHLYWDKSPMSWLQTMTVSTFHKLNPSWKIHVYVPKQTYAGKEKYIPDYVGTNFFSIIENNPAVNMIEVDLSNYNIKIDLHNILRSDILRYHLLYNYGGIWSDFDVVWLKPMEYLSTIVKSHDFTATLCLLKNVHHNISILISTPRHPFYKFIIDSCNLRQVYFKGTPNHQEYGTVMWNRIFPDLTGNAILKEYPGMVSLEYATFFQYSIYEMEKLYNETDLSVITENVICVHWFNGHELSKKYVNENNFNSKCSMTELIKLVGGI
jgi:mannosyltransferase OCH1-like enzyme